MRKEKCLENARRGLMSRLWYLYYVLFVCFVLDNRDTKGDLQS